MKSHRQIQRSALLGATSLVAIIAAAPVYAQTAPAAASTTQSTPEIVVTGYRASLQSALAAKRNSNLPIESVAPEDIGKMPDTNVAESLQRLPGVQIDRNEGQGTSVLIDGLRQNLTTLNGDVFLTGKEFYVSGEGSGGGAGGNSQYGSLEGIPSEEIGGIDVYKNPQAAITEGGLGGTIDLKTRDPLAARDGLSFGGNFRESNADGTGSWAPDGTLIATYKLNHDFAITGSISYDEEDTLTKEYQDQNRNDWNLTNAGSTYSPTSVYNPATQGTTTSSSYILPQLGYFTNENDVRKTLGGSLGLAWRINDNLKTAFTWFYSKEDDVNISYSDKLWFDGENEASAPGIVTADPYSISSDGAIQSATIQALGAETATLYQHNIAEANNFQWKTSYESGPLKAVLDLSYAHATDNLQADQADIEHGMYTTSSNVATSPAAPGCNNGGSGNCNTVAKSAATPSNPAYTFQYTNGGTSGLPTVSYLAPLSNILSNPAYTTFKSNWAWANLTDQKDLAVKADVSYDVPYIQDLDAKISAGVRIAERKVDQDFGKYLINGTESPGVVAGYTGNSAGGPWDFYQDPGFGTPNIPYSTATSDPKLALSVNNFAAGNMLVKNPYTGGMTDPATYLNTIWTTAGVPNNTEKLFKDTLSSFNVKEDTTAGYLMGDLGGKESHFHLNFGVRVVNTVLTVDGAATNPNATYYGTASWNGVNSNNIPTRTSRNYTDILPSFNFVMDLSDTQKVRLGAARVSSPQDLFSLGLGNSYNFTRSSNPCDLAHATAAAVAVSCGAGFVATGGSSGNANLDPYRATQANIAWEDYFAKGAEVSVAGFFKQIDNFVVTETIPTLVMDDYGGTTVGITTPENAGHGSIYGLELGGQYAFGDEFAWLKGFGVAANYTYSDSSSALTTSFSNKLAIPGVSKNAVSVTGYYERNGFSARLSYSYRDLAINDGLVGSTFTPGGTDKKTYAVYAAPYGQLDGQISYDFNKNLGVVFSVQNIGDSVQHTYLQFPDEPFTYDDSGTRYFLGFKFKY